MGMVLSVRVPDQNAVFTPAADTIYALPLDHSVLSTRQRADLWIVVGQWHLNNSVELHLAPQMTAANLGSSILDRMVSVTMEIFNNCRRIVSTLVDQTSGRDVWRGYDPIQRIALFRQFFQQDPYSVIYAMLGVLQRVPSISTPSTTGRTSIASVKTLMLLTRSQCFDYGSSTFSKRLVKSLIKAASTALNMICM